MNGKTINQWNKDVVPVVPVLPAAAGLAGFRRFRSSDNLEFISDGTDWLSTEKFPLQMGPFSQFVNNLAATLAPALVVNLPYTTAKIYVTEVVVTHKTATTMNATNFWSFNFDRGGSGGLWAALAVLSTWLVGRTPGTVYTDPIPINAFYDTGVTLNTYRFALDATKTLAPGNLEISGATIWYRLVG